MNTATAATKTTRHYYEVQQRQAWGWNTEKSYFTEKSATEMIKAYANGRDMKGTLRILKDGQIWAVR